MKNFTGMEWARMRSINGGLSRISALVTSIALSYDVASVSEITQCNKIDKPLVLYRFSGNVMTSTTTLRI